MNRDSEPRDTARLLSGFVAGLSPDNTPPEAVEAARMFIADYLAACFAGMRVNRPFNEAALAAVKGMSGAGNAGVLAQPDKLPPEHAAFMNAVFAHGADMDDGNRKSMGHIAASVMSAVFALAEDRGGYAWSDVFTAILAGYEVFNRIGAMAQPGLVHRGFHSTGTAGAVACGAACAKLLGLDENGVYDAMGIAAIQASGLFIIAESGQACKPLNPANAARTGIFSAKLAAAGIHGPALPLESKNGWFHAVTDEVHYEMLEGLGKTLTICESYLKPYPSCRHTHCGIEAAVNVREEMLRRGLTTADVESLRLYIYDNAIRVAGHIVVPATADEAKFSIHYGLAVALATGGYTLDDLAAPPTEEYRALTDKLTLVPDASLENTAEGIRGARLVAVFRDGTVLEKEVPLPKGDAANPFTWDDMKRKTAACMSGTPYDAAATAERVRAIDPADPFEGINSLPRRNETEMV